MDWTALWNTFINTNPNLTEICLRLACAMLVGLVIGTEREITHRPAGMRTHILVALGACVVSITGELLFHHYSQLGSSADPARLSAQVITGVGFLGAGTILREGATVKGLTTAASVWAVACLGIACGFGYYSLAIFGMVFIFITLTIFEWIQTKMLTPRHNRTGHYSLETENIAETLDLINEVARDCGVHVSNLSAKVVGNGHRVAFTAHFVGGNVKKRRKDFFDTLVKGQTVLACHCSDEPVHNK